MDTTRMREDPPKRLLHKNGHEITYFVEVAQLLDLNSRAFERTYETECVNIPTSWDLRLEFLAIREDGTASLRVTLTRTDTEDICSLVLFLCTLEATVDMQIYNFSESLIFREQVFERNGMLPGQVLQETVEISSLPDMKEAIKGGAVARISVGIFLCHKDTDM